MTNSKLDLRKKLNTVTDSEGNVFTAEKAANGYIVNCESQNKKGYLCFANDVKDLFMLFMDNDNQKAIAKLLNKLQAEPVAAEPVAAEPVAAEPVAAEPVAAEPVAAEPKKDNTMLNIKQALQIKPKFILAVNYDAGSLGEMLGEDRDLNLYLAEMTIQYKWRNDLTLIEHACLAFSVECLVSVNGNIVAIEQMDTCSDMQAVYAHNIDSLPNGSHQVSANDIDSELHTVLVELIENQPIYDTPSNFIIEAY